MQGDSEDTISSEEFLDSADGPDSRSGQSNRLQSTAIYGAAYGPQFANETVLELQKAIRSGNIHMAVELGKMLASMKLMLNAQMESSFESNPEEREISIQVYICAKDYTQEDRVSIQVRPTMTFETLKTVMFQKHCYLPEQQKWIVGRRLARDDEVLSECGINFDGAVVFLYLITPKDSVAAPVYSSSASQTGSSPYVEFFPGNDRLSPASPYIIPSTSVVSASPLLTATPDTGAVTRHESQHSVRTRSSPVQDAETNGWGCPKCTYFNKPGRPGCEMCSEDRPTTHRLTSNQSDGTSLEHSIGGRTHSRASNDYDVIG